MNSKKTKRIYECEHYKYEYDDQGKYTWCHSKDCLNKKCIIDYIFCQDICPFYKKNTEGQHIDIDFNDYYKEIRERCKADLREKAKETIEEASKEIESAIKKMLYAKKLSTI